MNTMAALQALQGVLTLVQMGSQAAIQIQGTIAKARSEGRDITDAELGEIAVQTAQIENRLLAKLQEAVNKT